MTSTPIGNPDRVVHVLLDPQALSGHGIDLSDLRNALQAGNHIRDNISVTADNRELLVQAGTFLTSAEEIEALVVGVHEGKAVYLRDVARVSHQPDIPQHYVWMGVGPRGEAKDLPPGGQVSGGDHRRGEEGGHQRGGYLQGGDRPLPAAPGGVYSRRGTRNHYP